MTFLLRPGLALCRLAPLPTQSAHCCACVVLGGGRADFGWKRVVQGSPCSSEQHRARPAGCISIVTSTQKVLRVAEGGAVIVRLWSLVLLGGLCSSGPPASAHLHLPRMSRFLSSCVCLMYRSLERMGGLVGQAVSHCIAGRAAGSSPFTGVTTIIKKHTQINGD